MARSLFSKYFDLGGQQLRMQLVFQFLSDDFIRTRVSLKVIAACCAPPEIYNDSFLEEIV